MANITRGGCVRKAWKPRSLRPILIYFEFRSKPSLITVICTNPHYLLRQNSVFSHSEKISVSFSRLFHYISFFFFLLFYVVINFYKNYFFIIIILLYIFFFMKIIFIFSCSGMFRNVPCSRFYRRPFFSVNFSLERGCLPLLARLKNA